MKRIIVDMDDVMADATGQFLIHYRQEFGVEITRESLHHKEELQGFPKAHHQAVYEFTFRENFFRTMAVKPGCQRVMQRLHEQHEVFIVSSAMEFPNSLGEKLSWLKEHFPFLHWKQFVFCGKKSIVHGDYMIDDLPQNLEGFNGEQLLFTAPHNMQVDRFTRIRDWDHVEQYFFGS
ncbi:MAG: 5' nucleotidase, NT5C type [Bacteroidota bacterium]